MDPNNYLKLCKEIYQDHGDPERADRQRSYLRNQFEHYGLGAPQWTALAQDVFKRHGLLHREELEEFVQLAFEDAYREIQYLACEMCQKAQKKEDKSFIFLLEYMIVHKSWWDTVDWLAKLAGIHFQNYPEDKLPISRKWINSSNIWLNRSAIIFQLLYRDNTDSQLLYEYILKHQNSKEFFIQKASGWALRQYSKYNPSEVKNFILNHHLPSLTTREGLKWIKKHTM